MNTALAGRLERELHGLLADIGLLEQRTDEFTDQEPLVRRFLAAWRKVVDKMEREAIAQIEAGKTRVRIE